MVFLNNEVYRKELFTTHPPQPAQVQFKVVGKGQNDDGGRAETIELLSSFAPRSNRFVSNDWIQQLDSSIDDDDDDDNIVISDLIIICGGWLADYTEVAVVVAG